MPLRPAPYTWVLPTFDPAAFVACARDVAEPFSFVVTAAKDDDEILEVRIEGTAHSVQAAATQFDSDRESIDPPDDGERYGFIVRFSPPDDADPRVRMEVEPHDDNWAAWSVLGPLAERLAVALRGTEITGDPPLWLQHELARIEPPVPAQLPFLALRGLPPFPGFSHTITFGREASIIAIDRILAQGDLRIALVLQRDPARERAPDGVDDIEHVATDARILRALRSDSGYTLILKAIARVRVREVETTEDSSTVTVSPIAIHGGESGSHTALRRFAKLDVLVEELAGTSLYAQIDELDAGFLADLVARASTDADLARQAYLELDPTKRATLVESAMAD